MAITKAQLNSIKPPYFTRYDGNKKSKKAEVIGYGYDPLGCFVGCAYFKGGGWLALTDLMKHHSIVQTNPSRSKKR